MDILRTGSSESLRVQAPADGKLPTLTPGEVVRARVVEVMPGGDALLRVKGSLIQAKTDLRLTPDTLALFRVLEVKEEKGAHQVRLQMMETLPEPRPQTPGAGAGFSHIQNLARELAELLTAKGQRPADFTATIERLLKALPDDVTTLPRDLRGQLQTLLQASLRDAEQNIQQRLRTVLGEARFADSPEWLESLAAARQGFAGVEKLPELAFQSLLGNTGVAFESKMRALAAALSGAEPHSDEGEGGGSDPPPPAEAALVKADLKAGLLDLRQRILDSMEQEAAAARQTAEIRGGSGSGSSPLHAKVLELLDGLLQDVETFQLLSRLTDSFYTFLPLVWDGLREGEIAFKRSRKGGADRTCYCLVQLDFEELGRLKIFALKQGEDFFVSFETDNETLRTVLKDNIQDLEKVFAEGGLRLKATDFHGSRERHLAPFERLETFESILSVRI